MPDYGIEDVATHTILLMLAVTKKLNKLMDTVKRGVWDFSVAKPVHRLAGRTFGTIGCGAIARSTIQKAQAFGMNVISYDPFLTQEQVAPLGITLKSMDEVAAESDSGAAGSPAAPFLHIVPDIGEKCSVNVMLWRRKLWKRS